MTAGSNVPPIIIKRKKVVAGGGHHGGAWKVAYADFVTAMMAFFMLMWLLNATTEKQRKGIADYFSPTIAVSRMSGGGDGSLGGHSVFSENTLPRVGTGASSLRPSVEDKARGVDAQTAGEGEEEFKTVEEALMGRGGDALLEDNQLRHVQTRLTDEGLIIEFFDAPGSPLFTDQDKPTDLMRGLLRAIGRVADGLINKVAVETHVSAEPVVLTRNTVWASSARRAEIVREQLRISGLDEDRIVRTTAHADKELANYNPMSVRNNRVEIVFLREGY
ncbi:flagellar motor protein MotB [Pseudoprimorskyibacter insulae]|uniref:Motility protein B n=1 Tax=Pseudoprimorskyibacter insulae TaxID=1695997 RepID=A0A2R8ATR6_9RHOB|nr:flagellar motor protein MotB [Pseudoprimorskyibacter insulae]SPF79428.1 Motility protein B [Pseudoprimorskyibacter insulae]